MVLFSTFLRIPFIGIPEILANVGFNSVIIDSEHSMLDLSQIDQLVSISKARGLYTIVRLPSNKSDEIAARVLDCGADAVMIPDVTSVDILKSIMSSVVLPPAGSRSFTSGYRWQEWGATKGFREYKEDTRKLVIPQIESCLTDKELNEILDPAIISEAFIGTTDLSVYLQKMDEKETPERKFSDEVARIISTAKKNNIKIGLPASSPEEAKKYISMGASLITYKTDVVMFREAAKNILTELAP